MTRKELIDSCTQMSNEWTTFISVPEVDRILKEYGEYVLQLAADNAQTIEIEWVSDQYKDIDVDENSILQLKDKLL